MKEPFDIWWEENMNGFGVSDELRKLLANAFAGGMEASSGMKSVAVKKMSYPDMMKYVSESGFTPYHIGDPEVVAIWPLPPSMAKEIIHHPVPATSVHSSPKEKLRSFMGDIKWGDVEEADEVFSPTIAAKQYDPSTDTWKTRTGSTSRVVGAEEWHTIKSYDDMSRDDREREMATIAEMLRKRIDESVLERVSESTGLVGHKLAEHQNEHIIAHREFVEGMSSHKDKIMSDAQRALLAAKKKEMSDRINKLAKKHKARK
jgi:hypothetical protein